MANYAINAKFMEEKLKIGWTTEQFARHFEMENGDFLKMLERIFSGRAYRGMKSRLERNDKKVKSTIKSRHKYAVKNNRPKEENNLNLGEAAEENLVEEDILAENLTEEIFCKDSNELVSKLQDERNRLIDEICQKELEHVNIKGQRKHILEELKKAYLEIDALILKVEESKKDVEQKIQKYGECLSRMKDLDREMKPMKERLEEVEKEIKSLKKIFIYVYENGEIESENFEISISESWNERLKNLMEEEIIDTLTVKETKQLAKIFECITLLEEKELEYEIVFDNENLQKVYENLKCS